MEFGVQGSLVLEHRFYDLGFRRQGSQFIECAVSMPEPLGLVFCPWPATSASVEVAL